MKAGEYIVSLDIYERDYLGKTTNQGAAAHTIIIKQVPSNVEVLFETAEVEPGTNLKVNGVLHDQTGDNIPSNATITLKDGKGKLIEKVEKNTGEFFEYPIAFNEAPSNWTVKVESNGLENEAGFIIKEKEVVSVVLINKTLTIVNTGNVFYNKSVIIKLGNETLSLDVELDVGEDQKYRLSAPDGDYQVEVITEESGSVMTGMVTLTGRTVGIKEAGGVTAAFTKPFVWIFMIIILGFVSVIVLKKGYRRSFVGYIKARGKHKEVKAIPLTKKSLINTRNKAELSLSIKGDKQNISLICLKVKNLKEIESRKSNLNEILQKIVDLAESDKAVSYENQSNLFFIFAPVKTKTFKNEKTAIDVARKIESILKEHNKMAKHKLDFGVSLNHGTIVAKQEPDSMKFMSMGTLITGAKKLSTISNGEVLLGEKFKERLHSDVKTEKQTKGDIIYYTVKEVQSEDHKKFIRSFLDRIEGDNKKEKR